MFKLTFIRKGEIKFLFFLSNSLCVAMFLSHYSNTHFVNAKASKNLFTLISNQKCYAVRI